MSAMLLLILLLMLLLMLRSRDIGDCSCASSHSSLACGGGLHPAPSSMARLERSKLPADSVCTSLSREVEGLLSSWWAGDSGERNRGGLPLLAVDFLLVVM
jgi:hypothetical protein